MILIVVNQQRLIGVKTGYPPNTILVIGAEI